MQLLLQPDDGPVRIRPKHVAARFMTRKQFCNKYLRLTVCTVQFYTKSKGAQIPGDRLARRLRFVGRRLIFWVLSVELSAYKHSGICNFGVIPRFPDNLCTHDRAQYMGKEFLVGRTQRVRVGQLSKEGKVTSGVPQGSVFGAPLFLVYVNDIWRNIDPNIRLFADDCIKRIKKNHK